MSVEMVPYDEFSMFHENASEFGLAYDGPPVVRRERVELDDGRHISALVWGEGPPELVLLHGGAQNAHTWDTVALALGRPLVCIDLPGHGHSGPGTEGSADVFGNAVDVAVAVRTLGAQASAVVGMSLGGMTMLALAGHAPELVRKAVLVDVTPGVDEKKSSNIAAFINGPESFDSFDDLLARTIEFNPTRTVESLRRGILHNAEQRPDGSWVWRYARFRVSETKGDGFPRFGDLWDVVSDLTVPLMLVRGMREQSVVDDADEAELIRRSPTARIEHVENAGHSVQGDTPVELAALIEDFAFGRA
ncbi:MAG: alpha/beta hydrolase [Acidimicrobiaceae bacterium]|nr:alpha/beta hydrolase [Acidimicrobiaceae bacterium]MYA75988.1 alpha/beta hydrolase [Acidimicrobiaceae bacterium]MYC43928.1 alpha/beta hydrolase [Acidimicrobiaceae bacterium]MYG56124.1 alpha/beta hydrolase [Acidimicrobiaceae bacterium]MYH87251.1 alpha/beta hydrolase [Acidimicrobiaceae bacterium]